MRPDWRARFADFAEAVRARCEAGERAYGDRSFDRPVEELLREIAEEVEDIAGWGFVAWCRLKDLEALCARLRELGGDHAD